MPRVRFAPQPEEISSYSGPLISRRRSTRLTRAPGSQIRALTAEAIVQTAPMFDPSGGRSKRSVPQTSTNFSHPIRNAQSSWRDTPTNSLNEDGWESDTDDFDDENETRQLLAPRGSGRGESNGKQYPQVREHTRSSRSESTVNEAASAHSKETDPQTLSPDQLLEEVNRLREQLEAQTLELDRTKMLLSQKLPKEQNVKDSHYFRQKVNSLRYDIWHWSVNYFETETTPPAKRAARHFQHLTPNYDAYLRSTNGRPRLIQARIWDLLQDYLFDNQRKYHVYLWAGGVVRRRFSLKTGPRAGRSLRSLESILQPDPSTASWLEMKEFYEWRAMTYNLLFPESGTDLSPKLSPEQIMDQARIVTNKIWRSLRAYAKRDVQRSQASVAKKGLKQVVLDAMALDLDMKKQKTCFKFPKFYTARDDGTGRCFYGYQFNPEHMDDLRKEHGKGKTVELLVAPALFKQGGAHGASFDAKPDVKLKAQAQEIDAAKT